MDELTLIATVHNHDVICIVETWLDGDIDDTEILVPGYHSQRFALELVSVVIQHNTIPTRICVSVFYRPPSSLASVLDDFAHALIETIDIHQNANVVVVGDFNIDVSSTSHPLNHKLSCMMSTYALSQMVSGHTRVHHSGTSSTIDLLFTSNPSLINDCITIPALSRTI